MQVKYKEVFCQYQNLLNIDVKNLQQLIKDKAINQYIWQSSFPFCC